MMRRLFSKLMKLPSFISYLTRVDRTEDVLQRYFRSNKKNSAKARALVLVQCVEDPYYFGLFGQIVLSLRALGDIRVDSYVHRSLNVFESNSGLLFLVNRFLVNFLVNKKWLRLYSSFCDGMRFGVFRIIFSFPDMLVFYRAFRFWRALKRGDELAHLIVAGVPAGDLIIDSYLRYKPAATVDLKDYYLCVVIWQAYRNVRQSKRYFQKYKPALYLTSYSTYVQHGIAVRVALLSGIPVFSFGNYQEFAKQLTLDDWMHTKDAAAYARNFSTLDGRDEKLKQAGEALAKRLAGGVDHATAYMKQSAYAETGEPVPDVRDAVIVFLHDFFDSPHVYHDMVFPDFWEWICFTIETLITAGIPFYIKPHPNQIDLSKEALVTLSERYPQVRFLSTKITNKQLAEAGMACAVTVYGTVAHEMAYLGVPSIASARHPHISFDFCMTARSRKEYKDALLGFRSHVWDIGRMREQSCAFYFMHNLNVSAEERAFLDGLSEFRRLCANQDAGQVMGLLQKIAGLPAFDAQIARWARLLI